MLTSLITFFKRTSDLRMPSGEIYCYREMCVFYWRKTAKFRNHKIQKSIFSITPISVTVAVVTRR